MKSVVFLIVFSCLAPLAYGASTNSPVIFPGDTAQSLKLVWPATPGLRYTVQQSTNLQSWSTVPGYPAAANGPAQQFVFSTTNQTGFFKVNQLDEQPPAIVTQYPTDGGFAVPRFSNLSVQLWDATGINTNSIQLTVGSLGTFTLPSTQLTFSNNLLTFINGGSIPLGGWGTNVQVTLIVADTLGNTGTNTWSFTLESQPQVVSNIFVFGSPQAQRAGQQIGNIPTRVLAQTSGPQPMGSGVPWSLSLVASNYLQISYTNTAPGFTVGQYVCNLTPASPAEIFNRKITAISDDPGHQLLTLSTVEVPLTEIVTNGSASISSSSMILLTGTNGAFIKAFSIGGTVTFPRIGYSLDGAQFSLKTPNDLNVVNLTMEQEHWWLTPTLQTSLTINAAGLQQFQAIATGTVDQASIWDASVLLAGIGATNTLFELPPGSQPTVWVVVASIGIVPVYAKLSFDLKLLAEATAQANLTFRAGESQLANATFGVTYNKPNDPQWVNNFTFSPLNVIPWSSSITAQGTVKLSLEPSVNFLVYGLAGVSAGITPSAGVVFDLDASQQLSGKLVADVSLDLGLAGPAFDLLPVKPSFSQPLWSDAWHLFPDEPTIAFDQQPQSQTVPVGGSAFFSCAVTATGTPYYQWYFNGVPMPGQTARWLSLPYIGYGYAGNYYVQVTAGGQTTNSIPATLTLVPAGTPSGLALIPAGSFQMGDNLDGEGDAPVHSVYVSAFYMDNYDVTEGLWAQVYDWAVNNGYSFDYPGSVPGSAYSSYSKGPNYPVVFVNWWDCVKWSNARSQQAGLTPVYYTDAGFTQVFTNGDNENGTTVYQNLAVNGYRLPTEAEWEKAARGGASGQRFPWGNTISESQANYYSSTSYSYDLSNTGYNPTFNTGNYYPYTSPVGYFAPNGYGLYDMAGNVWQWCWDRYGSYASGSTPGPRRVLRGGSWDYDAIYCRSAYRYYDFPSHISSNRGFRCVLLPGQ